MFDDSLFVRGAGYLERGQWLGPFDSLTLVKGPAYPMFIALTHSLGISLKTGEQLTYLLAALCVACCVWLTTRRRALSLAAYFVLAFDPVKFGGADARILRDGWSSSLALLFLTSLFLIVYGALTGVRMRWTVAFGLLSGLTGAAFLLCREEAVWLAPSVALVALGLPLVALWRWRIGTSAPRDHRALLGCGLRVAVALSIILLAAYAPVASVKQQNQNLYGSALTNDMASGSILRAYADWSRVEVGTPRRYVPISVAQRRAVYLISPAARELAGMLEDPTNGMRSGGCASVEVCDDFTGGWMIWALRGAAENAGHFGSASDAQQYFQQISDDITRACDGGSLVCADRLPAALQPLQRTSPGPWLGSIAQVFQQNTWSLVLATPPTVPLGLAPAEREVIKQSVSGVPPSQASEDNQLQTLASRSWLFQGLSQTYHVLLPVTLVLTLLGMIAGLRRPRWPCVALSVLWFALAGGVATHMSLLAIIDSSQFQASSGGYTLPSRVFLLVLAVVGSAQLIDATLARGQRNVARARAPSSRH